MKHKEAWFAKLLGTLLRVQDYTNIKISYLRFLERHRTIEILPVIVVSFLRNQVLCGYYIKTLHHFIDLLENEPFKMSSLKEKKFQGLVKTEGSLFVDYNKKFLTRTYPSGSRFDSSNYDPMTAWTAGCQIGRLFLLSNGEKGSLEFLFTIL